MSSFRLLTILVLAIAVGSVIDLKHGYPIASAAESAPSRACSSPVTTRVFADPPDVDVWRLPRVAGGDPEVILTVHRDAPASPGPFARATFCYHYHHYGTDRLSPRFARHVRLSLPHPRGRRQRHDGDDSSRVSRDGSVHHDTRQSIKEISRENSLSTLD